MDLIYADENFRDIGVLQGYSLDMAYGKDENDFVLEMPLNAPRLDVGNYIYIENTEYGGIVDAIEADTGSEKMTYSGRTWTGILASKIIMPRVIREFGSEFVYGDYYTVDGDANEAIRKVINRVKLEEVFEVESENSGIDVAYDFRYDDVNSGLFYMLKSFGARLEIVCRGGKPVLSAVQIMNYASADDFDSSIVKMKISHVENKVNHLVCLGSGEMRNRHVIHLYTNRNGGIQPYLKYPEMPAYEDKDYILYGDDWQWEQLRGKNEVMAIYDYPNVETVENYRPLSTKPQDWDSGYWNYYEKSGDEYQQIEQRIEDVYELTTSQPSNWGSTYQNYYTRRQSGNEWIYEEVEGEETETYLVVSDLPRNWYDHYAYYFYKDGNEYYNFEATEKFERISSTPSDWTNNYSNYYTTDGVNYNSISGLTRYRYNVQTQKPSDWSTKWKTDYYAPMQVMVSGKFKTEYVLLGSHPYYTRLTKAPKWKKNSFYTRESYQVAPSFSSLGSVYQLTAGAPDFSAQTVYELVTTYGKQWQANTFYVKKEAQDTGLAFQPKLYYRKVYDHFANLVAGGIQRLTELANADTLDVTLDETEQEFHIGDIIGATEQITKVTTAQTITKKIIKIERDVLTVRHEVN